MTIIRVYKVPGFDPHIFIFPLKLTTEITIFPYNLDNNLKHINKGVSLNNYNCLYLLDWWLVKNQQ